MSDKNDIICYCGKVFPYDPLVPHKRSCSDRCRLNKNAITYYHRNRDKINNKRKAYKKKLRERYKKEGKCIYCGRKADIGVGCSECVEYQARFRSNRI